MPPPAPGHPAHRADRGPPQPGVGQDGPRDDDGRIPATTTGRPAAMPAHVAPRTSRRRSRRRLTPPPLTPGQPRTSRPGPHRSAGPGRRGRPARPAPPGRTRAGTAASISAWAAPKNGLAETQRDRSADDGERQVEQVHHRRDGPTDERPRALHHCRRGQPGRLSRDGRQRRPGRLRLEAATAAALAPSARRERR